MGNKVNKESTSTQAPKECDGWEPNIPNMNDKNNMNEIEEPDEIEENDEIEWFVKNRYHKTFWRKVRFLKFEFDKKRKIKKRLKMIEWFNTESARYQNSKIEENKEKIKEMYQHNIYKKNELIPIIQQCELIIILKIPNDVIIILIDFIGRNGVIPIHYTLSCLPWKRFVTISDADINEINNNSYNPSIHLQTMEKWWDEARLSSNHCCIFYPKNINNAAKEFSKYLAKRIDENGEDLKYKNSMIPHILIDSKYNVFQKHYPKSIILTLPTKYSKCIGGIELFQRLYLETALNSNYTEFQIDLQSLEDTHGDNWCFDGNGLVLMFDASYKRICDLNIGDKVQSFPNYIGIIECVIVSNINDKIEMVELCNNCWITFEHPVLIKKNSYSSINSFNCNDYQSIQCLDSDIINKYGLYWVLPTEISSIQYRYQDKIYNFILNKYHTINVNGNWCCTLGHDYKGSVIQHHFWGNSTAIKSFLQSKSESYPNVVF